MPFFVAKKGLSKMSFAYRIKSILAAGDEVKIDYLEVPYFFKVLTSISKIFSLNSKGIFSENIPEGRALFEKAIQGKLLPKNKSGGDYRCQK